MARRLGMATRAELVAAILERYRSSSRADKQRILDEFVAVTGYHRKHAIRLLGRPEKKPSAARQSITRYDGEVREALVVLWEASDRLCSKRLKPMIAILMPALERHGRLAVNDELRGKLLTVSTATMDRLLSQVRVVARGGQRRRAGMSSAVRRSVPVRTFGDWNDPPPGYVEIDFVAHSGTSSSGSFVQTMVLTDIATGWTECVPVRTRDSGLVIAAIQQAQSLFPFPLLGVDFDNDSASLKTSWQAGETRPTHRRPYRRTKPYPKRPSMFEPYEVQIRAWLEAEPAIPAATVLERLMAADPSRFRKKSLRMVQRLVKAWRADLMGRIILDGDWIKRVPASPLTEGGESIHAITTPGNILR